MATVKVEKFNQCIDDINKKLDDMHNTVKAVKSDFLNTFQQHKESLQSELIKLVSQFSDLFSVIENMDSRVDELERESRRCDMVVSGIPNNITEKTPDIFRKICDTIGYVDQNALVFRVKARFNRFKSSPIIIRFQNCSLKSLFFSHYKSFGELKLSDIGLNSEKRIYCNDGLTKRNSKLLSFAKKLEKSSSINKAFTKRGQIFVIPISSSTPHLIRSENQLQRFVPAKVHNATESDSRKQPQQQQYNDGQPNWITTNIDISKAADNEFGAAANSSSTSSSSFATKTDSLIDSVIEEMGTIPIQSSQTQPQRILRSKVGSTSSNP